MRTITPGRYAVITSSIALAVALGGTGYAATQIGTAQIKNNAITTPKIKANAINTGKVKNNSLNGNDINENTLGKVPNAAKVNGATIVTVNYRSNNVSNAVVAKLNGLTIRVDCAGGYEALNAITSVGGGEISFSSVEPDNLDYPGGDIDDSFSTSETFVISSDPGNASDRTYRIHYSAADNKSVTAFLATEDTVGGKSCVVSGFLVG